MTTAYHALPAAIAKEDYARAVAGAGSAAAVDPTQTFRSYLAQPHQGAKGGAVDPAKADKVARDFEAMFLSNMLQPMFAGLHSEKGIFGGREGESTFQPMLVDEYAKAIARRGGLGIADTIKRQILATAASQSHSSHQVVA